MYKLAEDLFPICRSITGNGVRQTLKIIQEEIPLKIYEVPSGTKAFDWTVPKEWNIKEAWIKDSKGNIVVNFADNNLHVVGYSTPVDKTVTLLELQEHLYSIPDQSDAIPYVTSYYQERWGFCMAHSARNKLSDGKYHVYIDSSLADGSLTYGELLIPGKSEKEILLSTYVCHPSMANNELSGPVVTTYLSKWIQSRPRYYSYRIIFIPETIGSITYLSRNLEIMQRNMIAGFNINCVGDNRNFSYLPSRYGTTLADRAALRILEKRQSDFKRFSFLDRGSDERQYCSPGVDLPVVNIMRSHHLDFPEYHTSLDNLGVISPTALLESFDLLKECIETIDKNPRYKSVYLCEPQLGKRGLYSTLSRRGSKTGDSKLYLNILTYLDGTNDLEDLVGLLKKPKENIQNAIKMLLDAKLIQRI